MGTRSKPQPPSQPQGPPGDSDGKSDTISKPGSGGHRKDDKGK
jgi:hypothetical protein